LQKRSHQGNKKGFFILAFYTNIVSIETLKAVGVYDYAPLIAKDLLYSRTYFYFQIENYFNIKKHKV
jgi:hypothetical protein